MVPFNDRLAVNDADATITSRGSTSGAPTHDAKSASHGAANAKSLKRGSADAASTDAAAATKDIKFNDFLTNLTYIRFRRETQMASSATVGVNG